MIKEFEDKATDKSVDTFIKLNLELSLKVGVYQD